MFKKVVRITSQVQEDGVIISASLGNISDSGSTLWATLLYEYGLWAQLPLLGSPSSDQCFCRLLSFSYVLYGRQPITVSAVMNYYKFSGLNQHKFIIFRSEV